MLPLNTKTEGASSQKWTENSIRIVAKYNLLS